MERQLFNELINKAKITKKEFATLFNISQTTVNGWGSNRNKIPYWVESWLNNYIELQEIKRDNELNISVIEILKNQLENKDNIIKAVDDEKLNGLVEAISDELEIGNKTVTNHQKNVIEMQDKIISEMQEQLNIIYNHLGIKK